MKAIKVMTVLVLSISAGSAFAGADCAFNTDLKSNPSKNAEIVQRMLGSNGSPVTPSTPADPAGKVSR